MSYNKNLKNNLLKCIILLMIVTSCQLDDPKVEILASDVISLAVDASTNMADGEQLFILTAELLGRTDPNKDITFTTSYGVFVNGDKPNTNSTTIKSSGRTAIAKLQVTNEVEERIFVSASLDNYQDEEEVKTTLSYPETFDPFPDDLVVRKNAGNIVTVTVEAAKVSGKVSNGVPVFFSFIDTDTNELVINFQSKKFLEDEKTTVQIKSVNDSTGLFQFIIKIPENENGDTLVQSLNLKVE